MINFSARYSQALISTITPTCIVWINSLGSVAKLRPIFFREMTIALLVAASTLKAPSGNETTQRSKDQTISSIWVIPSAKLVNEMLVCTELASILVFWTCSLHTSFCMTISANFCYYSKFCSSSAMVSHTLSPISSKSPFVKVIGSSDDLVAFVFLRDPSFSCSLYYFP